MNTEDVDTSLELKDPSADDADVASGPNGPPTESDCNIPILETITMHKKRFLPIVAICAISVAACQDNQKTTVDRTVADDSTDGPAAVFAEFWETGKEDSFDGVDSVKIRHRTFLVDRQKAGL